MRKDLPPRKVPLKGHVPLLLPTKLLAWSEAHPDLWPSYRDYVYNCTKPQELEDLLKHLEGWSDTRSEPGQLEAVVDEYSGLFDKAEEEVKDMPPGADRSARFMKTLSALLTSSVLKIADKTPQLKVFDLQELQESINVPNANKVMVPVPAVPKDQLREDMVLCVSLLNLPSTISPTPYATE